MFQNEKGDIGNEIEIISNHIQRAFFYHPCRGNIQENWKLYGLVLQGLSSNGSCRAVPRMGRAAILRPFTLGATWPTSWIERVVIDFFPPMQWLHDLIAHAAVPSGKKQGKCRWHVTHVSWSDSEVIAVCRNFSFTATFS